MDKNIENIKYPIGKFKLPPNIDHLNIEDWIKTIERFPSEIRLEVKALNEKELEKTYRQNGWTIKQIVNHCADSHMNSYIRFKLTLTENIPTIKTYSEDLWAETSDSKDFPVESSIKILEGLHDRWVNLLRGLTELELNKQFRHPETNEFIDLKTYIGVYAWHCKHHLAHIKNAKKN